MNSRSIGGPKESRVEVEERRILYQGFFRVEHYRLRHRLYSGAMSPPVSRELFERGNAVAVLPYDPERDCVVLVEQFRIGALQREGGAWLLEIVAGIREQGEERAEVARREAQEEAGITLGEMKPICEFYVSPGGTSEQIALYVARVDSRGVGGVHGLAGEGEDIRVLSVPYQEAIEWLDQGLIDSASPIIALQWLRVHRRRLQSLWGVL